MTFAERLRELRLEKHYTLDDIGKLLHVGRATVYKYEHGIIKNMPMQKINTLAAFFDVSRPYLMGWTDNRNQIMSDIIILPNNDMFLKAYSVMTEEERIAMSDIFIEAYARYQESIDKK